MELFLLYLWTRLDAINDLLFAISMIGSIGAIILTILYFITYGDDVTEGFVRKKDSDGNPIPRGGEVFRQVLSNHKKMVWIPIIAITLHALIPSKQDAAIIVGGWGILKISKNDDVQQISGDTLKLIKQKLDKQLEQIKDNNNG